MSSDLKTSADIPSTFLDQLASDYREFVEAQPPALRVPLHTLQWSPVFRGRPGVPPPDFGQSSPVPVGSTRVLPLHDGRFSVRVLTPEGERPEGGWPVLLFIHGGGWVMGTAETGAPFFTRACVEANCVVVSVEYRLAPDHPFPAAIDDCFDTLRWVVGPGREEIGADVSRVAIAGVHSGGSLAAVLAQRASQAGIPLVLQILFTALTNATFTADQPQNWPPTMKEYANIFSLRALDMLWLRDLYLPNPADRALPDASPLLVDDPKAYEGMPPAFLGAMELDVLRSELEMYAEKMRKFGVPVTLKEYKGATHMTIAADRVCQAARDMRNDKIEALKTAFAKPTSDYKKMVAGSM
ncbi:carbohydrate esterase family 10 protein [Ceratobasidium sp. AG-Ba]|nr:carbohydrate esterase family 10 protein [Ceratobasidium sp. AG-Ba]